MQEKWKSIDGYEFYEISTLGRLRVLEHTVHVKGRPDKIVRSKIKTATLVHGYYYYSLYRGNVGKRFAAHRLVAQEFIPNPDNKPEVNHIDGDKSNNCVENLEWVTHGENQRHAFAMGLVVPYDRHGANNPMHGKHHSESAKAKIAEVHLGTKHSDETRDRMSKSRKGKRFSDEHKRKLSESVSRGKKGKAWVNKDGKTRIIDPSQLDAYLQDGWSKGRGKV